MRRAHFQAKGSFLFAFQNFARTHSPTRLMGSENTYSLSKEHCNLKYSGEALFEIILHGFVIAKLSIDL